MAKNNKERVFGRTEMYRHKLEENRDKKEHRPYTSTFFGVGLVTVVCFMLLFVGSIGVASATDWSAPVPDDHIQPLRFKVTNWPTLDELIDRFEYFHKESEKVYNGDGSWNTEYAKKHPQIRTTGRSILGYIDAYRVTGKSIYKQRAKEGLEYLLREQNDDGHFTAWTGYGTPQHGYGVAYLYETGIAEAALVEGYKFFGDERYLDAAKKAGQSQHGMVSGNANYGMFGAWGEAGVYEITGDEYYLDSAVKKALYCISMAGGSGQLPSGGWSDSHNQIMGYHGIITRGFVKLLSVMPESHPNYGDIEKATYKAMNHLRLRQLNDGSWLNTPSDSARHYTFPHQPAQAASMAVTHLDWPMEDSVHCAAKGCVRGDSDWRDGLLFATGSLLRAYSGASPPPPPPPPPTGTISGTVRELAQLLKSLFLNKIY